MAQTSTLRWVTDSGVAGAEVEVAVLATPQTSTLRWVTDSGVASDPVTVTVNDNNPLTTKSGTGSISSAASITGQGRSSSGSGSSSISVAATVSSSGGTKGAIGNGYIDWYGEVTAEGEANVPPGGDGSISVASALSSTGIKGALGTGTITGITEVRNTNDERRGFIDVEATLTASGQPAKAGSSSIAVLATVDGTGAKLIPGVISGQGRLRGSGIKGGQGSGTASNTSNELTGSAEKGASGSFTLTIAPVLEAVGSAARWFFSPLTISARRVSSSGLWKYVDGVPVGQTVLKNGETYTAVSEPSADQIDSADEVYVGGHVYPIDGNEAAALIAAGYGDGITVA